MFVSFFNIEKDQVRPETAVQIHYTQPGSVTGHIMLLCMLLMYTTAHHKIRQQSFETFWYTHHLFVPFLLGLYTHATGCFVRDTVAETKSLVEPLIPSQDLTLNPSDPSYSLFLISWYFKISDVGERTQHWNELVYS